MRKILEDLYYGNHCRQLNGQQSNSTKKGQKIYRKCELTRGNSHHHGVNTYLCTSDREDGENGKESDGSRNDPRISGRVRKRSYAAQEKECIYPKEEIVGEAADHDLASTAGDEFAIEPGPLLRIYRGAACEQTGVFQGQSGAKSGICTEIC